jgi:hypothetical protein
MFYEFLPDDNIPAQNTIQKNRAFISFTIPLICSAGFMPSLLKNLFAAKAAVRILQVRVFPGKGWEF